MQKNEIEFLLSAGYTIAEIMAMQEHVPETPAPTAAPTEQPAAPAEQPAAAPEVPAEQPAAAPPADDPQTAAQKTFNTMMDDMRKMFEQNISTMQAANIRNAVITAEEQTKTPEDLIANIIYPTMKERKEK